MKNIINNLISQIKKNNKYIIMFLILLILFISGILVNAKNNTNNKNELNDLNETYSNMITVEILGDVMYPGKYEVEYGTTIGELLNIAGFYYQKNEPLLVNKNGILENNEVINIKRLSSSTNRLNINTATLEEIQYLLSDDYVKAYNIFEHRKEHGSFKTIGDLSNVTGITSKIISQIINEIRLS